MSSSSRAIPTRCDDCGFLRLEAYDFLVDLEPLFPDDGELRLEDLPARFKDILLRGEHRRDRCSVVSRSLHPDRKRHPLVTLLLGLQPCFTCHRVPQLALKALHLGAGLGVVQSDQHLSGAHRVAVGDPNFPDDATLEVLNRLPARLRFHDARSDCGALQRRKA